MSLEHPIVMYIGHKDDGIIFDKMMQQIGGFAYIPTCAMEALAMYIQYMPDAIAIDVDSSFAEEVHGHLRDVDAKPMILVGDQDVEWADDRVYRHSDDLVAIIQCRLSELQQAYHPVEEFVPC